MNFRWFFVYFFVCFIAHLLSFLPFFLHPDFFSCFFKNYHTTQNSCLVKGRRICSGSHFVHASPRSGSSSISVSHYGFFSCLCLYRSGYVISAPPRRRSSLCRSWKLCLPHPYLVAGRLHTTPKAPGADAADCHHCFQVRGAIGGGGGWLTPACWRHISWKNEAVNLFIVEPPKKVNTIKVKLIVFGVIFLWLN